MIDFVLFVQRRNQLLRKLRADLVAERQQHFLETASAPRAPKAKIHTASKRKKAQQQVLDALSFLDETEPKNPDTRS